MDCGEFLRVASLAAKRKFGERATISIEEEPLSFPESHRWSARVKIRSEKVLWRSGPLPGVAARLLAVELVGDVLVMTESDRELRNAATILGIG